jgi:ABC-type antimicrobial peptide transport system, ATPase component
MKTIELSRLFKRYGSQVLFNRTSYSFPEKGLVIIVGESGSGKTSLLDIIVGLDVEYEGSVEVLGRRLALMSEKERSLFRLQKIGYIRQYYDLLELENGLFNVLLPLEAVCADPSVMKKRKGLTILRSVGLEKEGKRTVNTLSGGEKQRVALGRAVVNEAPILLCDEPTGALDERNAEKVFELLFQIGQTHLVVVVTHDEKRASRFANVILHLSEGSLIHEDLRPLENPIASPIPKSRTAKEETTVPFSFWMKHGFHVNQAKKLRTLLSRFILSFSFLALGLSLFISRDLGVDLEKAFSSLSGEGLVVMEPSVKNQDPIGKTSPVTEEETKTIFIHHTDFILDYGMSYIADFESFFPDAHLVYLPIAGKKFVIPDMSIRTVADALWLDQQALDFYPEKPLWMEDDEVALGLPYDTMVNLCLHFGILRDYFSLGTYLLSHPLQLIFEMANDSWSYTDEQILRLSAVAATPRPRLFHLNHRWNSTLLEKRMRFPTSSVPDSSKPWILQKLFYVHRRGDSLSFRKGVRSSSDLADFVFERTRKEYALSLYEEDGSNDLGRYYPFLADKRSLEPSVVEKAASAEFFDGFIFGSEGSYMAYPESFMSGFVNPFYVSADCEAIDTVIDYRSDQSLEESALDLQLPDRTVVGSYLRPASSSLTVSSRPQSLVAGRFPQSLFEVALTKELAERLGNPTTIFVAGEVESEISSGRITRRYRKVDLAVVGTTNQDGLALGVLPSWTLDFFAEALGVTSFRLEPTRAIFSLKRGVDGTEAAKEMSKRFPGNLFTDPSSKVRASLNETMAYVDLALFGGMAACLALSFLLLVVVGSLTVVENHHEGRVLFQLGLPKKEISNSYGAALLEHLAISSSGGMLLVAAMEYLTDKTIQKNFSYGGSFIFDPLPLLAIALVSGVSLVILQCCLSAWIYRRNFRV